MTSPAVPPSDEFLRTLLDIAPDAIAIVRGQTVLYMSPTGARMLGYASSQDIIGANMADWLVPDDAEMARERVSRIVAEGRPIEPPRLYRARTRDGRSLVAEVSSVPITYQDEPAVLAFVRDVTERQMLGRQLAESNRLAALGRLSAGVAHELNNPLTHLVLSVDSLRRILARDVASPEQAVETLDQVRTRLDQMAHDLDRMVVIARELRLFASPQSRTRGPVDLRRPVEAALRSVQSGIPDVSRIEVVRHFEDVPAADADAHRIEQVFANLLRNAFESLLEPDATREDAAVEPARVAITIRAAGPGEVAVDVADNGPGIPEADLERIFEPFFTTKAYGKGAGLGLALSRSIVQALDGGLDVTSAPGRGTTFTVRLPLRPASAAAATRRPASAGGIPLRVLVVDDEVAIGRALASFFRERHDVVATTSCTQALSVLASDSAFDVILCDVVMPGGSGLDFLAQLRLAHPSLERRLVFMTGATLGSDEGRSLAALPHTVLEKPFDLEQLEGILQDAARSG